MWTRSLLKQNAKQALAGRYWRCFFVSLVVGLLGGSGSAILMEFRNVQSAFTGQTYYSNSQYLERMLSSMSAGAAMAVGFFMILFGVLGLCWSLFVVAPLQVGETRYYMESRQSPAPYETVTGIFRKPYGNVVAVQLLVGLKITLGLLLIIPGIYWSYCYALVPYLLAENPYMSATRAMELSKEMMYGEKWNYFVLILSFIGWNMLAVLTMGIGFLFLWPYYHATYAEFYAAMRSKALAAGMTTTNELGGFVRHESG